MLSVALTPLAAVAQESEIPSVDVRPAEARPHDPNSGQWFFLELAPGQTGRARARITNPARVPQRIKLSLKDLVFGEDGNPFVKDGEQTDVGAWGRFDQPETTVPAETAIEVEFAITPPLGADPGDHIGAVVAESEPQGSQLKIIKRVATRLYVTIPGEVIRSFRIESVSTELDSSFWPNNLAATIALRNTGRVRLHVGVTAKGLMARGPRVLLSRSVEEYLAGVRVAWWGGPVRFPIEAVDADSGLIRRVNVSKFIVPWGPLLMLVIVSLFGFGMKRWWERRASRLAKLQADIRRLEALVAQRPTGPLPGIQSDKDEEGDEVGAILAAIKRARRTESQPSLERLALALHESGTDALEVLLEAVEKAGPERRDALIEAAASYGAPALLAQQRMELLPGELAAEITLRASGTRATGARPETRARRSGSSRKRKPARAKSKPPSAGHRPARKPRRG